jgi:mono/diheme cytochrome c family protein
MQSMNIWGKLSAGREHLRPYLGVALFAATTLFLSACTSQISVSPKHDNIISKQVTETPGAIVYPDDNPSIPDGKVIYDKMSCAQCHGVKGEIPVQAVQSVARSRQDMNKGALMFALNEHSWADNQQPVQQYSFLTYGKPNLNHPILNDKLTVPQRWALVFYVRSLATPAITDTEWAAVDPVWGSNCAVCHGKRGNGDGPLTKGNALEPVPANFHSFERFYARSDNVLYSHIAYGIPWEGMPNFLGKYDHAKNIHFDAAYIHKLIQYVRAFHSTNKPVATAAAQ